ncbi:hypothetical protein [Raoultella terrigena]|uniref:hypothetical protein n=1 Tax=Raoultella terrigena TaxID=577 RepID=UPI00161AD000|nr:hypothetical protein [Raoultella terrigena]
MRVFYTPHQTTQNAHDSPGNVRIPTATHQRDQTRSEALATPEADKINLSPTKSALHRTRLRFLDRKVFSVGNFYKRPRQPALLLGGCGQMQTEKNEKNFSFFQ